MTHLSYAFDQHLILQTPTLWSTYRGYNYMIAHQGKAYIFDPGEFQPIDQTLNSNSLEPIGIYLTHHHPDHVAATQALKEKYHCSVYGFKGDVERLPEVTHTFGENELLNIAELEAQVLFLPGHTLGLCAFYFKAKNWLFSNDLIFSLGCGRVFEGSFEQMHQSLKRVRDLDDETVIFPSHEYTLSNLEFGLKLFPNDEPLKSIAPTIEQKEKQGIPTVPTTLAFEKRFNPFLRWDDTQIRSALQMQNAPDWQIFAEIRKRKDQS